MAENNGPRSELSRRSEVWLGLALLGVVGGLLIWAIRGSDAPLEAGVLRPSDLVFWALALMAVVSAAGVAFSRNIIYSALSLLGALLAAGGLYLYLNADFIAVTQLLIYVGGVMVLILFAVMLTSRIADTRSTNPRIGAVPGFALLVALLGLLGYVAIRAPWKVAASPSHLTATADSIGDAFLGPYLLPFEVASLVLLATLIGAVVVARKEIKE